jgi:transmembrane sensor
VTASGPCNKEIELHLEAAATWRVRIQEDDAIAQSPEFIAWLADGANLEAYARTSSAWQVFEDHSAAPEIIAIRRDALHRARAASRWRFVRRRRFFEMIAATLVFGLLAGLGTWQIWFAPLQYSTGIGERRAVALKDGSRISLDSNTAVRVDYGRSVRRLVLERGRARFDVAHDVSRPFTVTVGDETVVAVGTSFSVERLNGKVLVTLIQGRVVVQSASRPSQQLAARQSNPTALIAGQELVVKADARPEIRTADLPIASAWESGRLVFNNEPLGEAVERVNRYTDRPLSVDPSVANLRISGVFDAGDVGAFIDAVTSYFPVSASTSTDNHIVLQKHS